MLRVVARRYFAAKASPAQEASAATSHRPTKPQQTRTEGDQWIDDTGRAQFEAPRARGWLHPLRVLVNITLHV